MATLFLDTSALVRRDDPLEPSAQHVRGLCHTRSGHSLLIAAITPVEVAAAFNRKLREGRFSRSQLDGVWRLFRAHWRAQYRLIRPDEPILRRAQRLPFAYPVRAFDAVQLASALRATQLLGDVAVAFRFCTADHRLADAAEREGLAVELIT